MNRRSFLGVLGAIAAAPAAVTALAKTGKAAPLAPVVEPPAPQTATEWQIQDADERHRAYMRMLDEKNRAMWENTKFRLEQRTMFFTDAELLSPSQRQFLDRELRWTDEPVVLD